MLAGKATLRCERINRLWQVLCQFGEDLITGHPSLP